MALRLHGWLRLLRLPNLFTVPGDPLAGVAAAVLSGAAFPAWRQISFCALASVCLYCAGLIFNDLCDFNHDWVCRPNRPLPSGQVSLGEAALGLIVFIAAGLFLAAKAGSSSFLVAVFLLSFIGMYCVFNKWLPTFGAVMMGLCRGCSVMLCVPESAYLKLPLFLAAVMTLYVAGVTIISRGEDRRVRHGITAWIPVLIVLAGFGSLGVLLFQLAAANHAFSVWMLGLPLGVGLATVAAIRTALQLIQKESRKTTRKGIGHLIRAIPFLQFAVMVLAPPLQWAGMALLGMTWVAGTLWSRRYPGS